MIGPQLIFLVTGTMLVFIGIVFIAYSRNMVKSVMSFQAVLFGANLALFASVLGGAGGDRRLMGDSFIIFSILVGASVEAVGLALIAAIHRRYGTLNPEEIRRLRH